MLPQEWLKQFDGHVDKVNAAYDELFAYVETLPNITNMTEEEKNAATRIIMQRILSLHHRVFGNNIN